MLILKTQQIKPFEEKVLASGLCDFSLPASFVNIGGEKNAVYDSCGYTCVDDITLKDTDNMLELIEKTAANLGKAGEFLIDPAHIVLDGRTVFQNLRKRDVKFAYLPSRHQQPMENMMAFLDYFENRSAGEDREIIRVMSRYFRGRDLAPDDIVRHISVVRRDLKTASRSCN